MDGETDETDNRIKADSQIKDLTSENMENFPSEIQTDIPTIEEKHEQEGQTLHHKSNLVLIIEKQDEILKVTEAMKQKLEALDEVSKERLQSFHQKSLKYGKYLKLIQGEFFHIHELLKKINREIS